MAQILGGQLQFYNIHIIKGFLKIWGGGCLEEGGISN